MDTNEKLAVQNRAFLAQLRSTVADIKADKFGIDGAGETLSSVVSMVVEHFGEDTYKAAKRAMGEVTGEKDKIVALLESVLDQQEQPEGDGDPNDGSLFSHVLKFVRQHDPSFQPGKIIPQIRKTSRPMNFKEAAYVRLLVDIPRSAYPEMSRKDKRHLPTGSEKGLKAGDMAYAKLDFDGLVNIVPFSLAGSGWELIKDAEEGVHYEFV